MSTPNFWTQRNFPLYCFDNSEMEWIEAHEFFSGINEELNELNDGLRFFRVVLHDGYYCGVQLYVEMQSYAEQAGFTEDDGEDATNEDCRYYLDMCRSEAIRKYEAEQRKVRKLMQKIADAWGFEQYYCVCIFSNGEAVYEKASPRTRLKSAALGYAPLCG